MKVEDTLPVIEVGEMNWIVAYNMLIAMRDFAAAQKILDWFMPRQEF
jgi:hypothetical protein